MNKLFYLILFLLSFSLTFFIRKIAIKKALLASVNERSSHTVPTPHGGGVAIAITWFVGMIYQYNIGQIDSSLFFALLLGLVISIVSFVDDIYDISPSFRLILQFIIALNALYLLGGLQTITLGVYEIKNQFLNNMVAVLLIVWFINLYNFLDGINGYAGSEAVFLSMAGLLIFGGSHFGILAVCVLGFLYWNWNKAKIFMGDVGSTLLGYNIAIFTIFYSNQEASNFWIWITLFSVFWFDATLTLIRRKRNGEKLSQAHKKHAYQRLTQVGWSHYKVVNYSIIINLFLLSLVYLIDTPLVSFLIAIIVLYILSKLIDNKKAFV